MPLQPLAQRVTNPTIAGVFAWSSKSSDADVRAHATAFAKRFGDLKSTALKNNSRGETYVILAFCSASDAGALIAQRKMDPLDGRIPSIKAWTGGC